VGDVRPPAISTGARDLEPRGPANGSEERRFCRRPLGTSTTSRSSFSEVRSTRFEAPSVDPSSFVDGGEGQRKKSSGKPLITRFVSPVPGLEKLCIGAEDSTESLTIAPERGIEREENDGHGPKRPARSSKWRIKEVRNSRGYSSGSREPQPANRPASPVRTYSGQETRGHGRPGPGSSRQKSGSAMMVPPPGRRSAPGPAFPRTGPFDPGSSRAPRRKCGAPKRSRGFSYTSGGRSTGESRPPAHDRTMPIGRRLIAFPWFVGVRSEGV